MGSGFIACCRQKASKVMSSILPRSQSRGGAGERRPISSTARRWCGRWSPISAASRECVMVGPPSPEEVDRRRITRERNTLTGERARAIGRTVNRRRTSAVGAPEGPDRSRTGSARTASRAHQVRGSKARHVRRRHPPPAAKLLGIKGIGPEFATVLWSEGLFRHFDNRRQVASYAGLAPTPWQSGAVEREQGVSKAGNPRLRTTMIRLAWLWLGHQPRSALTRWVP